jgi:hypothetical protein
MPAVPLASLLLRASRWFDRQLLEGLQAAGWPALTAAQSLVLAHLDRTGTPPAELARRLGHSRQATHQPGHTQPARPSTEPARRGGRLVTLTDSGHAMTGDAAASSSTSKTNSAAPPEPTASAMTHPSRQQRARHTTGTVLQGVCRIKDLPCHPKVAQSPVLGRVRSHFARPGRP